MTQSPVIEIRFAICIHNAEYASSLERRKIYQVVPDEEAARHQLLRVVDESGEDYLYPANYFLPLDLPPAVQNALLQAA
jgi:hypothetical protein